jgi:pyruvate/2-oxoglutarate dehydrogenase complex dihydrolipoamide dehydrogenase (E3) component
MEHVTYFQGYRPAETATDDANQRLLANVHPADWENPVPAGKYNLVVIGGGSAGMVAAIGAAGLGAKVALIERHLLGGDCLNVGCVPSKTVIRSAKMLGEIARASSLGVQVGDVSVDFGDVMARMRRVRADLSEHDSVHRVTKLGIDMVLGDARFTGKNTIEIDGRTLHFSKAVIATGSRPASPPIAGLAETGHLTNEKVWDLTSLPPRLAVIGAGPIGAELAQAFRRFGSGVTVFDVIPRLLGREDEQAAGVIHRVFEAEGIGLALGADIELVSRNGEAKQIAYRLDGNTHTLVVDEILVAAGRLPNLEGLDVETAGVVYNKQGVEVDDTLRTTNPDIYAAGDVASRYQFTHTADATARIVLQNALFPGTRKKLSGLIVPWATYTDPEVAHVGMYDWEAEKAGIAVDTFVQSLAETDRGRTDGEENGFVKVHVKKGTDKILGATIVGRHAGELISEVTVAMTGGLGLRHLATVIHPYPTEAEAIRKVADAYNRTRLTPLVAKLFKMWFGWRRRG